MPDLTSLRCHCNNCARPTIHDIVATRVVEYDSGGDNSDLPPFWWKDRYEMLQCRGCGSVCLRDIYEDVTGKQISYFPPPVSRRSPAWRSQLPSEIREVLEETYVALHNDGRRLALMGARTLVDMLIVDKVGDAGSFQEKLVQLQSAGMISARGREVLAVALDAGNAAAHRGYKPDPEDLSAVIDIVENLLQATYHLNKVAARIKLSTPTRTVRGKPKPKR